MDIWKVSIVSALLVHTHTHHRIVLRVSGVGDRVVSASGIIEQLRANSNLLPLQVTSIQTGMSADTLLSFTGVTCVSKEEMFKFK